MPISIYPLGFVFFWKILTNAAENSNNILNYITMSLFEIAKPNKQKERYYCSSWKLSTKYSIKVIDKTKILQEVKVNSGLSFVHVDDVCTK